MLVVGIVGVLAALALYGVRKYLLNAKTTEARNGVGQMAKDAKGAFERESMASGVMRGGATTRVVNNLCADAAHPVPENITSVQNAKYQSRPDDWTAGPPRPWASCACGFRSAIRSITCTTTRGPRARAGRSSRAAYGDLDADGVTSSFTLSGRVTSGVVFVSPNFGEQNPEE